MNEVKSIYALRFPCVLIENPHLFRIDITFYNLWSTLVQKYLNLCDIMLCIIPWEYECRDVTRTLIEGGGVYSYIHVLPDRYLFKLRNLNLI